MTESMTSNFWDATSFLMREMYASRFCPCGAVFDAAGAADADWAGSVFCATATEARHTDSAKAAMPFLIIFLPSLEKWFLPRNNAVLIAVRCPSANPQQG